MDRQDGGAAYGAKPEGWPQSRPRLAAELTEENRRILLGMWDNLGRVIAEYPHLATICETLEGGRVEIAGLETVHALIDDGKPGILFGAHLANWKSNPSSPGIPGSNSD